MHKDQEEEVNIERIEEDKSLKNVFLIPESGGDELESKEKQNIPNIVSFDLLSHTIVKKEKSYLII